MTDDTKEYLPQEERRRRGGTPGQRTETQRLVHRQAILVRHLMHRESQPSVARDLGISLKTLKQDVAQIRREQQSLDPDVKASYRVQQLDELARLRTEAWAAWERSRQDVQKTIREGKPGADGKPAPVKVTVITEQQTGDPRYLGELRQLLEREARLLGLDMPVKNAATNLAGDGPAEAKIEVTGGFGHSEWLAGVATALGLRDDPSGEAADATGDGLDEVHPPPAD